MGTNVKLYYTYSTQAGSKWELIPSRLFIVEDIESYLATKTCKAITDFQYIKNELEITINVDITQDYSQPRTATSFKYVSIQNSGELVHYYFVKKATWRSKTCVRFDLVMDVINTFQEGRDFNFKANTRIVREHKDRFNKRVKDRFITFNFTTFIQTGTLNENDSVIVYDNTEANLLEGYFVSFTSEGIQGQLKMKISENETRTDEEIISAMNFHRSETIKIVHDLSNFISGFLIRNTITHTHTYFRNIDIVNEGISPVLQNQTAVGNKIENPNNTLRQNWYLLYRNQNDPSDSLVNPVNCYLIPENNVKVDSAYIESGRLVPSWLEEGYWYFFSVRDTNDFTLSNGVIVDHYSLSSYAPILMISKTGNKLSVQYLRGRSDSFSGVIEIMWSYDDIDYIDITGLPAVYNSTNTTPYIDNYYLATMTFPYNFNNSGSFNEVDNISNLDRGDPKNIKLIKLPYAPYNFEVVSAVLQIEDDDTWEYASFTQQSGGVIHALKLKDMNKKLSSTYNIPTYQPLTKLYYGNINASIDDLRGGIGLESKLFHSDFYQPTYVYDSFTYKVQLEKLDVNLYYESSVENLSIRFDMTSTINSRFMFTFNNLNFRLATENYAKYMPIARNNEEVLYNVPYINFIKNGFNYDVKAKTLQNTSNIMGLGLSLASSASALLLPSVPLKIAGVVAGLVSMAMSIKNTVVSAQQSEDSIRRKLNETANQASSVAGSDDVDLMSVYAENRLKYLVYEPTPLMKSILFDLFFYAGYASGRMAIPTHNNRVNFDYLECEANLENEGSIPDECLQELINCFRTGATYLHKTDRATNKWDFEQKYENWERDVMED